MDNSRYILISKESIKNESLTLESKGFLITLLIQENGFKFKKSELLKIGGIGIHKTNRMIKELIDSGNLIKESTRRVNGSYVSHMWVAVNETGIDNNAHNT